MGCFQCGSGSYQANGEHGWTRYTIRNILIIRKSFDFARKTVELMSYHFPKWPFPYPHETVFDGLDQMEYPMMVNDNPA